MDFFVFTGEKRSASVSWRRAESTVTTTRTTTTRPINGQCLVSPQAVNQRTPRPLRDQPNQAPPHHASIIIITHIPMCRLHYTSIIHCLVWHMEHIPRRHPCLPSISHTIYSTRTPPRTIRTLAPSQPRLFRCRPLRTWTLWCLQGAAPMP